MSRTQQPCRRHSKLPSTKSARLMADRTVGTYVELMAKAQRARCTRGGLGNAWEHREALTTQQSAYPRQPPSPSHTIPVLVLRVEACRGKIPGKLPSLAAGQSGYLLSLAVKRAARGGPSGPSYAQAHALALQIDPRRHEEARRGLKDSASPTTHTDTRVGFKPLY